MKKHPKNGWFRRAAALLLSLTTTASVAAAAVPLPTAYDSISVSAETVTANSISAAETVTENSIGATGPVLVYDEAYAKLGEAPVAELDETTKKKIEDMDFYVDFAPNHYVASRKLANNTKYYPDGKEPWGYKVYGTAKNDNWFYRSIRWFEYYKKGDDVDPFRPYSETRDRADYYWHGSWKKYPDRYDVGSTTYLRDCDAWHSVTSVEGENRIVIENKHSVEGVDKSTGSTYCCGITTVPIKVYFTVPANTTYRVTLKFSASTKCVGESSLALIDSHPGIPDSTLKPDGDSWVVNTDWVKLKYNEFANSLSTTGCILAYDMIPKSSNTEFEDSPVSQTRYFDYQLVNNSDGEETFMRCFYLVVTQAMDYKHESHSQTSSYYDGEVSISVANLHYDTGTTELVEEKAYSSDFTVSIGSRSTTVNGSSLDYGMFAIADDVDTYKDGVDNPTRYYIGEFGNYSAMPFSVAYQKWEGADSCGTVELDNTEIQVKFPEKNSRKYYAYTQIIIPVKVSYTVPANTVSTVEYTFDNYVPQTPSAHKINGEACLGVAESPANGEMGSTIATYADLKKTKKTDTPNYYSNVATLKINGEVANRVGSRTSCIDVEKNPVRTDDGYLNSMKWRLTKERSEKETIEKMAAKICEVSLAKELAETGTVSKKFTFDNSNSSTNTVFERYFVVYFIREVFTQASTPTLVKLTEIKFNVNITCSKSKHVSMTEEKVNPYAYLTWKNDTKASVLDNIESEDSDKDPASEWNWYRLVMSVPQTTQSYGSVSMTTSEVPTFTGQVSGDSYTNVQPYYTHPLGKYLRYAWLYNGVNSEPGADGYNLARPLCELSSQALPASFVTDSTTGAVSIPTQPVAGTLTKDDYQSWYIKAADGNGGFYLAMEGTDGKRYLLCHNVTVLGDSSVEHTLCFVTASEYNAYPELYQTAYAWPITSNAAANLSVSNVGHHRYKGFWQKTADESSGSILSEENLRDEAFRFPVTNNLVWHCVKGSDGFFYGFSNEIQVQDITASSFKNEDYSLYAYYQNYKGKTGTVDQKLLSDYSTEIQHCLNAFKTVPAAYVGAEGFWVVTEQKTETTEEKGYWYWIFHQVDDINDLTKMALSLGTYTRETPKNQITVGNGQVYKVTGTSRLSSGETLLVEKGGTLQITGTLVNEGTLICYGTVIIEDGGCLRDAVNSVSGIYNFTGGNLIIATNGVFRQSIADNGNGIIQFLAGSTVSNDGLFIAASGFTLNASTLNNGTNGVVMTACTLRASSDVYTAREFAMSFPRGMPDGETQYKLVREVMVSYIDQNYCRFSINPPQPNRHKPYLTNHAVIRNNGVMYCTGGIFLESGTDNGGNVLIGKNPLIMYTPLVNGTYEDETGATKEFSHSDMAFWGFYLENEPMNNKIEEKDWQGKYMDGTTDLGDSSNFVKFGVQSVTEALTGSTMSTSDWNSKYNDASKFKISESSGGGC